MFGKIFIKEWRDNLALFALGVIVLLGVLGLHLGHQDKAALFTLGAFLMFVLPGLAFLIGASGFQNEFKNNSWTYLFSRPVAKPCIWTAKYVSQLSILAVLVGLWAALRLLAPGLGRLLGQLDWPADHLSIGSAALYLLALFLAFTAAFSMSFLSDRPLLVFAAAVLVVGALVLALYPLEAFLWGSYFRDPLYFVLLLMIIASFALASLLTFIRADLSQRLKTALRYTGLLAAFLVLSFVIQTMIVSGGNPFNTQKDWLTYQSVVSGSGKFFFGSVKRGLMEYDPASAEARQISASAEIYGHRISVAGGKIAFVEWLGRPGGYREEIRVIRLEDHREIGRVEFHGAGSPFGDVRLMIGCLLSADGERLCFAAAPRTGRGQYGTPVLFWMKSDGRESHRLPLDFVGTDRLKLLGWMSPEEKVVLLLADTFHNEEQSLAIVDLATGTHQKVDAGRSQFVTISPRADFAVYESLPDETHPARLMLVDLKQLAQTTILEDRYISAVRTAWAENGDRLAFNKGQEVFVYSLPSGLLVQVPQARNPQLYYYNFFDWLGGGKELAVFSYGRDRDRKDFGLKDKSVKIFDSELREKRSLPFPEVYWPSVWAVGDDLFVGGWEEGLWRLDLKKGEWKRIY